MMTPFLYDDGEEHWTRKYHMGCGGVYLRGYYNCDVLGFLDTERPDLVNQNETTITDYYARLDGDCHNLPKRRETVCDMLMDASKLLAMPGSVDKILAVQLFEHLTPVGALWALKRWRAALRMGGVLIMSVPDMTGTLDLIEHGDTSFALRHLRGRQGDKWNSHHAWYTRETLIELLEFSDFDNVIELPNMHFYPAITVKAIK